MAMDSSTTNPQAPEGSSVPIPSDKEIEYVTNALGTPSLADPTAKLPGHTYANPPGSASAAAYKRYQAATAAAVAKSNAQYQRDTQSQQPQHPTFTPVPRQKKGK